MNCIIIDDEDHAIRSLKKLISKVPDLHILFDTTDPVNGLKYLTANEVDFTFLDINMEGINGLALAKLTTSKIVVTSAHGEHALVSYEYPNIVDYLLKPIEYERLLMAVSKVKQLTANAEPGPLSYIEIKTQQGITKLSYDKIDFIKADRAVSLINGTELVPVSIAELQGILPDKKFKRVHRSFIVNFSKVTELTYTLVKLGSEISIPVGRSYRQFLESK